MNKDTRLLLKTFRQKVDYYINDYVSSLDKHAFRSNTKLTNDYISALGSTIKSGGKRIRPALMYYSYLLAGGEEDEGIIKLSIFLEILQSYLLIHDDIIDNSPKRRKQKTTHIIYKEYAEKHRTTSPKHYGQMMALLIGDLVGNYVYKLVLNTNIDEKTKLNLLKIINQKTESVLVGQIEDLHLSIFNKFTLNDIKTVHQDKTVTYSFELPILTGLCLASNKDRNIRKHLLEYSKYAGFAFQIQDDILGIFGNPAKTGKPNDTDIKEGKKTHLLFWAFQHSKPEQKRLLRKIIGKRKATKEEIEIIRNIIEETGGKSYAEGLVDKCTKKAEKALFKIDKKDNIGFQFLNGFLDILHDRKY